MNKEGQMIVFYCPEGSMMDYDSRTRKVLCLACGKQVLMGTPESGTIQRVEYSKVDILLLVSQALSQRDEDE